MSLVAIVLAILASQQAEIIVLLVCANVLVSVAAAIHLGRFDLKRLADWTTEHLIVLLFGYGAAALVAAANPGLAFVRDAAFISIAGTCLAYVLENLQELGIIPSATAQKAEGAAGVNAGKPATPPGP